MSLFAIKWILFNSFALSLISGRQTGVSMYPMLM